MLDSDVDYRVFTALYGAAPAPSRVSADLVARELNSAALGYRDLPLFMFNAYAAPGGEDIPGYGTSHRRIAFGDGVLDGFAKRSGWTTWRRRRSWRTSSATRSSTPTA